MKKFLFFISLIISAQTPSICRITDFSPAVKSISFGSYSAANEHCTLWFNSPTLGQVQIACYLANAPTPIYNTIQTPTNGLVGVYVFSDGIMSWLISPGHFHISGAATSDSLEVEEDGTF